VAAISTKIADLHSLGYSKLCFMKKPHSICCVRTTAMALGFPELAIALEFFAAVVAPCCD